MDSGILMIQDSILVCSPDPRIPHTAKVAFHDAIFPGQKLYQPVNGKLLVVWKSQRRLMEPPANAWPNPRGKQRSTQTVFWDQHTKSTKKRVLGRNRLAKAKKEMVISLSLKEILEVLPSQFELVLQEYNSPLKLSLNNLLGAILGEDPVPNKKINAEKRKEMCGFNSKEWCQLDGPSYGYASAC
jgi:hypothetical protein